MSATTTLYRYTHDNIPLTEALNAGWSDARLIGYVQAPDRLVLDTGPSAAQVPGIYEARFFNEEGELRWFHDPAVDAAGRAVWLTEQPRDPVRMPSGFRPLDPLTALEAIDHLRLGGQDRTNQVVLQTRASIPGIPPGERAVYIVREYLGPAPGLAGEDGNWLVIEHRIRGIQPLHTEATP